jgi:hypothetical protein
MTALLTLMGARMSELCINYSYLFNVQDYVRRIATAAAQ